jgi:hypothetical protein
MDERDSETNPSRTVSPVKSGVIHQLDTALQLLLEYTYALSSFVELSPMLRKQRWPGPGQGRMP